MTSEWKVSSNLISGKKLYGVYRIRNTSEVDHSGNREMHGEYMENREVAAAIAEKLNREEVPTVSSSPEDKIRILKVEPGKDPYIKEIDNTLAAIQSEVEGYFEALYFSDGTILCCNEEGKLREMTPNRFVGTDLIVGPFFITAGNEDGEFISLTDQQLIVCTERFGGPYGTCKKLD